MSIIFKSKLYICSSSRKRKGYLIKNTLSLKDNVDVALEAPVYPDQVVVIHIGHHLSNDGLQLVLGVLGAVFGPFLTTPQI